MRTPASNVDTRSRLLQAAEKVTYRHGFSNAAIADIAREARVPLGNVYYYFKTKNEIGNAIIEVRVSRFRKLLHELDKAESPKERLCGFVQIKIKNREELARSGCPVGTLCSELRKDNSAVAKKSTVLFATALDWMEAQFKALGKGKRCTRARRASSLRDTRYIGAGSHLSRSRDDHNGSRAAQRMDSRALTSGLQQSRSTREIRITTRFENTPGR